MIEVNWPLSVDEEGGPPEKTVRVVEVGLTTMLFVITVGVPLVVDIVASNGALLLVPSNSETLAPAALGVVAVSAKVPPKLVIVPPGLSKVASNCPPLVKSWVVGVICNV